MSGSQTFEDIDAGQVDSDLQQKAAEAETKANRADEAVDAASKLEAEDRSAIARQIIVVFICSVAAVLYLLLLEGFLDQHPERGVWADVTAKAAELIKTSVLPIVTLVLGYYFGRSAR